MYSLDGITWLENALTLPLTATERQVSYGQGIFVITSDDTERNTMVRKWIILAVIYTSNDNCPAAIMQ